MGKHSAKIFDSNKNTEKKTKTRKEKNFFKSWKLIIILLLFLIIILLALFIRNYSIKLKQNDATAFETNKDSNSVSLSSILSTEEYSKYETRKIENTNLILTNLFLKFENNITVIKFEICNESTEDQPVFDFTFSLLDENNLNIISYDLSSEEIIPANSKKQFVLIASRDVSNATDFKIDIKK